MSILQVDLSGPADTPFAGGLFRIKLVFGSDYPQSSPKGWFLTRIFHPNMNYKTGEICLSTLKKDWNPKLGLRHALIAIRCLLIEPNPESALNEDAAKLMLDNYADYFHRAKIMTKIHAKPATNTATATPTATDKDTENASATATASTADTSAPVMPVAALAVNTTAVAEGNTPATISPAKSTATDATNPTPTVTAVVAGEEENKNTSNAKSIASTPALKKPLSLSAASNAPTSVSASAKLSATSAAEAKAKALKKKSLKRL